MTNSPNSIYLSLGFENLMSSLYGYAGHSAVAGHTDLSDWKKHLIRVVGTLRTKIRRSITGDDAHRDHLMDRCEVLRDAIKRSKSKDEVTCYVADFGFEIAFLLVGGLPNNFHKPRTRPDLVTAPPPFRTLTYSRTAEQRARQILDAAYRDQRKTRDPSFEDLFSMYQVVCKKDPQHFLKMVKGLYPEVYERVEG